MKPRFILWYVAALTLELEGVLVDSRPLICIGTLTPEQMQLFGEQRSLFDAWIDRGVKQRDVVSLFAVYFSIAAQQGNIPLDRALEFIAEIYVITAQQMQLEADRAKRAL